MKPFSLITAAVVSVLLLLTSCGSPPEVTLGPAEVVTTGFQFTEGPHWLDDGSLIFSDIPANTVYRWQPGSSESTVYIDSSGGANGIEALPGGDLVLAQHAGRVSRMISPAAFDTLASAYEGKRLNSPNDLAIRSDSVIYFTDPTFGVSEEDRELDVAGVYRIDPDGSLTLVYDKFALPNGVAFSPDEAHLYVNDSETGDVVRFDVQDDGELTNETLFANIGERSSGGAADGMITDADGRLYTTGPKGILVFNTEGGEVGRLDLGQQVTNVEWHGTSNDTLYVTSRADVFRVPVQTKIR
jgi:gluconolactonase